MAETNFRQNLSGFAWARPGGVTDDSETNPFARFSSSLSGYIPVRSGERTQEEEAYFALSRWERFIGFLICCAGATVCFGVAFLKLTFIVINPTGFATAFSLGSVLFMIAFAVLSGPIAHFKHITTKERIPFTAAYFGSLALTLYFAIGRKEKIPTLVFAIIQVGALISYFITYFPGGWQTLSFGSRMALRGAGSMLPV